MILTSKGVGLLTKISIISDWHGAVQGQLSDDYLIALDSFEKEQKIFIEKKYHLRPWNRIPHPGETSPKNPILYNEILHLHHKKGARDTDEIEFQKDTTLIFLLGHSTEPLYLSVGVHLPGKIYLVVSDTLMRDHNFSRSTIERRIRALYRAFLRDGFDPDEEVEIKFEVFTESIPGESVETSSGDAGMDVFCKLRDLMVTIENDSSEKIILDITGSKKNMVTGAFLFGVYNRFGEDKKRILHYVDHMVYDFALGRPQFGTCYSSEVKNIYTTFKLSERKKLKEYFDREDFLRARDLAGEINKALSGVSQYRDEAEFYGKLYSLCEAYYLWRNCFYEKAYKVLIDNNLDHFIQKPIEEIADSALKYASGTRGEWGEDDDIRLLKKKKVLLTYFADVIAYNERMLEEGRDGKVKTENPRENFLKVYSIFEMMLEFHIYCLIEKGKLYFNYNRGGANNPTIDSLLYSDRRVLTEVLHSHIKIVEMLKDGGYFDPFGNLGEYKFTYFIRNYPNSEVFLKPDNDFSLNSKVRDFFHEVVGLNLFKKEHIKDWPEFIASFRRSRSRTSEGVIFGLLSNSAKGIINRSSPTNSITEPDKEKIIEALNSLLKNWHLYNQRNKILFDTASLCVREQELLNNYGNLTKEDTQIANRILLESTFPNEIEKCKVFENPGYYKVRNLTMHWSHPISKEYALKFILKVKKYFIYLNSEYGDGFHLDIDSDYFKSPAYDTVKESLEEREGAMPCRT